MINGRLWRGQGGTEPLSQNWWQETTKGVSDNMTRPSWIISFFAWGRGTAPLPLALRLLLRIFDADEVYEVVLCKLVVWIVNLWLAVACANKQDWLDVS